MLKKMNLPNKLTMLRIILVPVFMILMCVSQIIEDTIVKSILGIISLVVFVVAAITDTLDGQISRKNNIVTKFGKIMDPLADKLLVSTGFIMLTGVGVMPAIVTAVVVFRDFFVNALRMFGSDNQKDVAAGISGKVKTVCQMLALVLALVSYVIAPTAGIFAFIAESSNMSAFALLVNVGMSVFVTASLCATIWSFVDYFKRFKDDIDVEH